MDKKKQDTAKVLAQAHFEVEPNLKHVFVLEPINGNDQNEPIALLEVLEGTIERGIEPIAFTADPDRGIDYPSVIVEVSPREFEEIWDKNLDGQLGLDIQCKGWKLGKELKQKED